MIRYQPHRLTLEDFVRDRPQSAPRRRRTRMNVIGFVADLVPHAVVVLTAYSAQLRNVPPTGAAVALPQIREPSLRGLSAYHLGMPSYVNGNMTDVFPTNGVPHPDDVLQGGLGNCMFAAILSAWAGTERGQTEIMTRFQRSNVGTEAPESSEPTGLNHFDVTLYARPSGGWTFPIEGWAAPLTELGAAPIAQPLWWLTNTLTTAGHPVHFQVSDRIPVRSSPEHHVGLAGKGGAGNWASLIEKAIVAKNDRTGEMTFFTNGYAAMNNVRIHALFNTLFEKPQVTYARRASFDQLADWFEGGALIAAGTGSLIGGSVMLQQGNQVLPNHGYALVGVDRVSRTLTVRNPWGKPGDRRYINDSDALSDEARAKGYLPEGRMVITERDLRKAFTFYAIKL